MSDELIALLSCSSTLLASTANNDRSLACSLGRTPAAGTPYVGGTFNVRCTLSKDFPVSPPKAFFTTKIFHPNVSRDGEICVHTLKKDWKPDLGLKHILLVCLSPARLVSPAHA